MSGIQEFILPDGTVRRLGNNRPPTGLTKAWPIYGDTPDTPMISRSQWPALISALTTGPDFPFLPPVHDQNGVGQCNCEDTAALVESTRLSQGLPLVLLSAADLYDRINGGSDNGSLLEDAMHELISNGIGTAATCGTLWKSGYYKGPAPAAERARFKVLEAFICPTFEHCMSAAIEGFRLSTGIEWASNYNPDSEGWLPRARGVAGGHAIMGYKPAIRDGEFGIWHQNSWGTSWGVGGRFVIPEPAYEGQVGGWWAVRSVTDEGGDFPAPKE